MNMKFRDRTCVEEIHHKITTDPYSAIRTQYLDISYFKMEVT